MPNLNIKTETVLSLFKDVEYDLKTVRYQKRVKPIYFTQFPKDLDEINPEFEDCDVALILGANDVVNPAARHDQSSPIYGMPILNVDKSRTVIINKRSMNPGFAGVQNELFGYDNSIMVFGDAKDMLNDLLKEVKEL